jgi:hypothetical protein
LCKEAIEEDHLDFEALLPNMDVFEATQQRGVTTIKTWAKRYPSERGYEVFLTLSR